MTIYRFNLFNEWRGISIYGENLQDAILRKKTLQRPDKFADGRRIADGETFTVKSIIGIVDTSSSVNVMRDIKTITRALVEMDGGQIVEVDAIQHDVNTI